MEDDEITLKDLILKIKEFWRAIWKNWWIVVLTGIVLGGIFVLRSLSEDPTYAAKMEFSVKEDEGGASALAGIGNLLGNFGLGGAAGTSNLDRILAICRSDQIIYPAIFDTITIEGQSDMVANHLIRIYEFHESWNEKEKVEWHDFFFSRSDREAFSLHEQKVMKLIAGKIRGGSKVSGLMSTDYNEDTGFMRLNVQSLHPDLSQLLMEIIYNRLAEFYVTRTIAPQQRAFNIIRSRKDSLENRLAYLNNRIGQFNQQNRSLILETRLVERQRLEQDRAITVTGLGEALKSFATSEFLLLNATPFLQVINQSVPPLEEKEPSKLMELIKGGFLGGFLAVFFIIVRKVIRDAMREDEPATA